MKTLLKNLGSLCRLLREGDYAVLDPGFRDVKADLKIKKINVLMPVSKKNRKQITTKNQISLVM